MAIDFAGTARAALGDLEQLLGEWLPGGRLEGREYKALNPTRADRHIGSFCINLDTGVWQDFATGDRGGDAIALYAYLNRVSQGEAARAVGQRLGLSVDDGSSVQATPEHRAERPEATRALHQKARWVAITPVPADAGPPPQAHFLFGRPVVTWCYRDASGATLQWVYRFEDRDGCKSILPCVWAKDERSGALGWKWKALPAPRPLYGLDRLAQACEQPVLLVEGEKCADAAHTEIGERFFAVTWPGGVKAVGHVDWTPLAGRRVVIWPDCDAQRDRHNALLPAEKQPGMQAALRIAALLRQQGCAVSLLEIPAPAAKSAGWDVADAIGEGLHGDALAAYIDAHRNSPTAAAPADAGPVDDTNWRDQLILQNGKIAAMLSNLVLILRYHPAWRGLLAFNTFELLSVKQLAPPWPTGTAGDWGEVDDSNAAVWMEANGVRAVRSQLVGEAIEVVARERSFHPVQDYLATLHWDGEPRLDTWLIVYLGAKDTPYVRRVARYFLIGMVLRALQPGSKFDTMLVLEGPQGQGKTSALQILGRPWFGNTDLHLDNKDSMLAIRGKWLYEIAELDAFARSEATRQKSFISRDVDDVRLPYARRTVKLQRQVVFCGSTNQTEWNKDVTGGRRFWSIATGGIDLAGLAAARDQLFAEALMAHRAGEACYPTPEEQATLFDPEQQQRIQAEPYDDMLATWIMSLSKDEFGLAEAITDGLKVPAAQLSHLINTRVGMSLRRLGCTKTERRNALPRWIYRRPATLSPTAPAKDAA